MRNSIKEIKRKCSRIADEVSAIGEIAKYTSLRESLSVFRAKIDIQVMCRNGYNETAAVKERLLRKHATIISYFEKKYADYWIQYKPVVNSFPPEKFQNTIWVCWWQGIENAPKLVKACIQSIQKHAQNSRVIIITDKNVDDYVKFPDFIKEKLNSGKISRTFYSDLLRLNLLSSYGGMWLDSTFFATSDLSKYSNMSLWTIKRPEYLHASPSCGRFATYSISCNTDNRWMFKVILDFLYNYWQDHEYLVDYLLIEYAADLSLRHFPEMNDAFAKIVPNNLMCDNLEHNLSEPFDSVKWQKIKEHTDLFKLSWKSSYQKEKNGMPTFYSKLICNEL